MLLTITFKIYYIVPGSDTVLLGIQEIHSTVNSGN